MHSTSEGITGSGTTNTESVTLISFVEPRNELKQQHEKLIEALNEDIRRKTFIDASQFVTYNPVGGVFMPITDEEKQIAVQQIANTAPSLINLIFKKHWVTTALGVVAILPQILTASGVDLGGWSGVVSAIASGVGLIFAKSVK